MRRPPRAYREEHRIAVAAGWRVEHLPCGHLAWWPPDATRPVVTAATPTPRGHRNDRARLRRAGLPRTRKDHR